MNYRVFKYYVPIFEADLFAIEMNDDAEFLCVKLQNGHPHIWALVDTDKPISKRHFCLVGTGQPIPGKVLKGGYRGTFLMDHDRLVLHLFERHV